MLVKILGAIDFIGGIILMLISGFDFSVYALIVLGIIFLAKSCLGFLKNFASWIDFVSGTIFILMILGFICIIIGLLLIYKKSFKPVQFLPCPKYQPPCAVPRRRRRSRRRCPSGGGTRSGRRPPVAVRR